MKYVCTFIIYKENKHMNLSYNVKNNYEKVLIQLDKRHQKMTVFGF